MINVKDITGQVSELLREWLELEQLPDNENLPEVPEYPIAATLEEYARINEEISRITNIRAGRVKALNTWKAQRKVLEDKIRALSPMNIWIKHDVDGRIYYVGFETSDWHGHKPRMKVEWDTTKLRRLRHRISS